MLRKPDLYAGRPVPIDYTNFTRPQSSFPCSKTDVETLNRHGNNHRSRSRAHSPQQVPGPARVFYGVLDATWHLNLAPGGRHQDYRTPGQRAPAGQRSLGPPSLLRPRPVLTAAAPHRCPRRFFSRRHRGLSLSSRPLALCAPLHARADPPRRPP